MTGDFIEVQPEVGSRVRIGPREAKLDEMHPSYVADTDLSEDAFAVVVPSEFAAIARIGPGDVLRVCLFAESGLICSRPRVLARRRGTPATLKLENPRNWMRVQRREHVRLQCSLDLELRRIEGKEDLASGAWTRGRTLDLSAGGVKVQCTVGLEVGEPVDLILSLPDQTLSTRAWVLRDLGRGDKSGQGMYSLEFSALSQEYEDEIVSFIFAEQLRRRRAGLVN